MSFNDCFNYVLYDNPISKQVTKTTKQVFSPFFRTNGLSTQAPSVQIITKTEPLWKLAREHGPFIQIAGLSGATAVILGAYGAHKKYPKDRIDELKPIYETANKFHFFHSLALLGVPLCKNPRIAGSLIITGTVLFTGPCYYHAFTGENKFGKIAPIGGTLLILGWLSMVI